jgi:type IV secretion system protein VirD4
MVVLTSIWIATELTAWRLGFARELGPALFAVPEASTGWLRAIAILVGGIALAMGLQPATRRHARMLAITSLLAGFSSFVPVYAPLNFVVWWWRFGDVPGTASIWHAGAWIITLPSHLAFVVAMIVAVRKAKEEGGKTDTHGSARWANAEEVEASGLLGNDDGVYVGAWEDDDGRIHYLRHAGPQNVLCFAPSRSGKGVGLVIPTLLSWRGSVVVNDIKGENWALTAGWRKEELSSVCIKFDPTSRQGDSARYNPLLEVRPWPEDVRDAQTIADILVDPDGNKNPGSLGPHGLRSSRGRHPARALRRTREESCRLLATPCRPDAAYRTNSRGHAHNDPRS